MLEVKNLSVAFRMGESGTFVPVTHGVDFSLAPGATLGIVGESGSGKSVTSMAIMGLLPQRSSRVTADALTFEGRNLLKLNTKQWRELRGKDIALVFQDPLTSPKPFMRWGGQIAEANPFPPGQGRAGAKNPSTR